MGLAEYKEAINSPLIEAVVCFIKDGNKILLITRKSTFANGMMAGLGGKKEKGETLELAVIREIGEETKDENGSGGITIENPQKMAELDFYFPHKPSWNQKVTAFIVSQWSGIAKESKEAIPVWTDKYHIPWDKMWHDNSFWLPPVLAGKKIKGEFLIGEDLRVVEYKIEEAEF